MQVVRIVEELLESMRMEAEVAAQSLSRRVGIALDGVAAAAPTVDAPALWRTCRGFIAVRGQLDAGGGGGGGGAGAACHFEEPPVDFLDSVTLELMTWPVVVSGGHAATAPMEFATLKTIVELRLPHPIERTPVRLEDLLPARDMRVRITSWLRSAAGNHFLGSPMGQAYQDREREGCRLYPPDA